MKAEIIHSLTDYFHSTYNTVLKPDENLFHSGIIDSLGFVALITFLEETFDASLEPEDLIEDNFDSLETIANLISGKKA